MEELLGILEPMCDVELVHECGTSETEEMERHDIYEYHNQAQAALADAKAVAAAAHAAVVAPGAVVDGE